MRLIGFALKEQLAFAPPAAYSRLSLATPHVPPQDRGSHIVGEGRVVLAHPTSATDQWRPCQPRAGHFCSPFNSGRNGASQ